MYTYIHTIYVYMYIYIYICIANLSKPWPCCFFFSAGSRVGG